MERVNDGNKARAPHRAGNEPSGLVYAPWQSPYRDDVTVGLRAMLHRRERASWHVWSF